MKLPSPAPSVPGEVHHSASSVPVDDAEAVFPALRQRALAPGGRLYGLAAAAAVVMPALAVAEDGMRLGQGGGYYDRFLAELPRSVPTVALVFEDELLPAGAIPAEPTDRPVDGVVTAAGLRWI